MIKWEYKTIKAYDNFTDDVLDSFGVQGWELITMIIAEGRYVYAFKRPKNV